MRVLNQLGPTVGQAVRDAVPDIEVIDVPMHGEVPPGLTGEILLAVDWSPIVGDLLSPDVRWVHGFATGVEGFPPAVFEDGRVVTCARGANSVAISEWVLAVMLAFEKRLPDTWIHDPSGFSGHPELGMLEGKCLGLVGFGGIGQAVARRALAFDMDVIAVRRKPEASPMPDVSVVTELEPVLSAADHLVLAAPATARTRHIIGRQALAMVHPGVHLVNVARGWLVDSDALLESLEDGRVARASLDVTEPEPLPADHPLWAHPNVRISPHLSFKRPDLLDLIVGVFIDNLRRYLRGEPLQGVVDPVEGY